MTRSNNSTDSFSIQIKKEISKTAPKSLSERQAFLGGIFCQNSEKYAKLPPTSTKVITDSFDLIAKLVREEGYTIQKRQLSEGIVEVSIDEESKKSFEHCFAQCYKEDSPDFLSSDRGFSRAFIRGVYLGCGYCSDPQKTYRIEFHLQNPYIINDIIWMLHSFDIHPSLRVRQDTTVIYFKDGDSVSDFLALIGATTAMLDFENARAEHEVLGNVTRTLNCDARNTRRQAEASALRIELVQKNP